MPIFFITGNKNKFKEAKAVINNIVQYDIDLPEIQDVSAKNIIIAKLIEALKHKKGEFIVEDTSLYLECLNGLPGPLIKWFMKTIGNDGIFDIAKKYDNYNAVARTFIGYANISGEINFFEGSLQGKIVAPKGDSIFGWDPIFMPKGHLKTFAEMPKEEKNKISMRQIALNKLSKFIKK